MRSPRRSQQDAAAEGPRAEPDRALLAMVLVARQGGRQAQAELFARFHRAILGFCLAATRYDREQALDLTQDVFERAFRSLSSLRDDAQFERWLFSIAHNVCRSRVGRERARELALAKLAAESDEAVLPAAEDDDDRMAVLRELISSVGDPRSRTVIEDRYLRLRPVADIAAAHGMPLGTVTVTLMRFRGRARKRLLALRAEGADDAL